jgi:hypothetical protein
MEGAACPVDALDPAGTACTDDGNVCTNDVCDAFGMCTHPDTGLCGCALSPGFWGGGEGVQKWDEACDPIAADAGFMTSTPFPWLAPRCAGSSYLDVLGLSAGGDVTIQLAFKYIAARLNEAAFGVQPDVAALLDQIDVYFMSFPVCSKPKPSNPGYAQGRSLKAELDAYFTNVGEALCPETGDVPECL